MSKFVYNKKTGELTLREGSGDPLFLPNKVWGRRNKSGGGVDARTAIIWAKSERGKDGVYVLSERCDAFGFFESKYCTILPTGNKSLLDFDDLSREERVGISLDSDKNAPSWYDWLFRFLWHADIHATIAYTKKDGWKVWVRTADAEMVKTMLPVIKTGDWQVIYWDWFRASRVELFRSFCEANADGGCHIQYLSDGRLRLCCAVGRDFANEKLLVAAGHTCNKMVEPEPLLEHVDAMRLVLSKLKIGPVHDFVDDKVKDLKNFWSKVLQVLCVPEEERGVFDNMPYCLIGNCKRRNL